MYKVYPLIKPYLMEVRFQVDSPAPEGASSEDIFYRG